MATIDSIARPANASRIPLKYEPNKALGRSGYIADPEVQLSMALEGLDGLLCLLSMDFLESDPGNDFQRMNHHAQLAVLQLASETAHRAHELQLQLRVHGGAQ